MNVVVSVMVAALVLASFLLGRHATYRRARRLDQHPPYAGKHVWGDWSDPYEAWTNGPKGPHSLWQMRTCQCGNRDWRPLR